ncbi:MAG: GAF domain-containing protein [Pirellulales bacterium]
MPNTSAAAATSPGDGSPGVDSMTGDSAMVERRQAVLLDVARRANAAAEAWPLAEQAVIAACGALDLSCYGFARCSDDLPGEINLRFAELGAATGAVEVRCTTEPDRSAIGYALHTARPLAVADLDEELRFSDPLLCRRSIRSALISPLMHESEKYGVIAVFGRQPHDFQIDDVCFFELLTRLISSALATGDAKNELKAQRQLTDKMLETTEALVVRLSPRLRIQSVNRAFAETSGFDPDEMEDRSLSSAVLDNDDLPLVKHAFDRIRHGEENVKFESGLLTKGGELRQIAWSYTSLTRSDGVVESLIGTGVDITDQCQALARLEQVERIARAATQRLNELQDEVHRREATVAESADNETDAEQSADAVERRSKLRVPFPRMQEIAPIIDGKLPDQSRFLEVRCHDISAGGFSFFLPNKPDFEELVVALGDGGQRKYFSARVLHVQAAELDGRRMKLVGCEYASRLELISNSEQGDYFVVING